LTCRFLSLVDLSFISTFRTGLGKVCEEGILQDSKPPTKNFQSVIRHVGTNLYDRRLTSSASDCSQARKTNPPDSPADEHASICPAEEPRAHEKPLAAQDDQINFIHWVRISGRAMSLGDGQTVPGEQGLLFRFRRTSPVPETQVPVPRCHQRRRRWRARRKELTALLAVSAFTTQSRC